MLMRQVVAPIPEVPQNFVAPPSSPASAAPNPPSGSRDETPHGMFNSLDLASVSFSSPALPLQQNWTLGSEEQHDFCGKVKSSHKTCPKFSGIYLEIPRKRIVHLQIFQSNKFNRGKETSMGCQFL